MIHALLMALGLVFVIEGLLYALVPGHLKNMMRAMENAPEDIAADGWLDCNWFRRFNCLAGARVDGWMIFKIGRIDMLRNFLGGVALSTLVLGFVASPMVSLPAAAQVEQKLPSVADLAERLLPAVVEISVQVQIRWRQRPHYPVARTAG